MNSLADEPPAGQQSVHPSRLRTSIAANSCRASSGTISAEALEPAPRIVVRFSQAHELSNDAGVVARRRIEEEAIIRQGFYRTHGGVDRARWTHDRYGTKGFVPEKSGLRHDQVGLEQVCSRSTVGFRHFVSVGIHSRVQIGKAEIAVRNIRRIAGLVLPSLVVHG